jgi:hypothetical protein
MEKRTFLPSPMEVILSWATVTGSERWGLAAAKQRLSILNMIAKSSGRPQSAAVDLHWPADGLAVASQ